VAAGLRVGGSARRNALPWQRHLEQYRDDQLEFLDIEETASYQRESVTLTDPVVDVARLSATAQAVLASSDIQKARNGMSVVRHLAPDRNFGLALNNGLRRKIYHRMSRFGIVRCLIAFGWCLLDIPAIN
jgi:hypothetical protein